MKKFNGVYPAIVLDNVDPQQSGRVEVELPLVVDPVGRKHPAAWARVATLMAGNQRGTWFMPDKGDEVLVAFEGGDPRRPYVIGALWNSRDQPPEQMDPAGANHLKVIHSRQGLIVTLDDQAGQERLAIESPGGQSISLKDGPGSITLTDSNGNTITLETAGISVTSSGKVTVNASVIEISTGMLTVNAGISRFSGVVRCDTLITNSVVSASYTPGAGNVM
jgi:uncharacterized protein involved in type VI secretion and phage assembly